MSEVHYVYHGETGSIYRLDTERAVFREKARALYTPPVAHNIVQTGHSPDRDYYRCSCGEDFCIPPGYYRLCPKDERP